jgi:hypothetical protein
MTLKYVAEVIAMNRIERMKARVARNWALQHYASPGRGPQGLHPHMHALIVRMQQQEDVVGPDTSQIKPVFN